jgi:hypothetical protein
MKLFVQSVGLIGPGMASWATAQAVLRGDEPHTSARTQVQASLRLPPAERRRAGQAIKVAMAVADEAVTLGRMDPQTLATVFTSSSGEGTNCHNICETLASDNRAISPTRFANSVHNAPAGYWHIAVASRAPSTSICAFDGSFAAGLIEAGGKALSLQTPVLLVASDTPYPEPLHATRPLADSFGVAFILTPRATPQSMAALEVCLAQAADAGPVSACSDPLLEALRALTPAARALPLLQSLARGNGADDLLIDYLPALKVRVAVNAIQTATP